MFGLVLIGTEIHHPGRTEEIHQNKTQIKLELYVDHELINTFKTTTQAPARH